MKNMIEMRDIVKMFGPSCANDHISLSVKKGEIISLLGENGAGKTTLMNVLFGLCRRDSGSIALDGVEMPVEYSPQTAIEHGIAMVHQHLKLVETFTVAQNVILGAETMVSRRLFRREKCERAVGALCSRYGMDIDPKSVVSALPLGAKQRVEILKALYRGCKVLILDEPTTVLTPQETDALFDLLRSFQAAGMTIIIITHKLHEVMAISSRVLVLRQGKAAAIFNTNETTQAELAATMIGKTLVKAQVSAQLHSHDCPPSVELRGLSTAAAGDACPLRDVNLNLYAGRIVGVAGVDGNGQTALVEVLAGVKKLSGGSIQIGAKEIKKNTSGTMRQEGIQIIPEDRHRQGLVLAFSVYENIMLGYRKDRRFVKDGVFRKAKARQFVSQLSNTFDIRPRDTGILVKRMSGGNQQKVVLARELSSPDVKIVVVSQPTRGLDAGAIQSVHSTLLKLREEGKTILLISSDLDEIKALSDEIAILYNGSIAVQRAAQGFADEAIGLYMGGGKEV